MTIVTCEIIFFFLLQAWNESLINCCKQTNVQVAEQLFGLMQQTSVTLEENVRVLFSHVFQVVSLFLVNS